MKKPFPVTARDTVEPSDPAAEPSREHVNQHPENDAQRLQRTRRYFRLSRMRPAEYYARGLDTNPSEFA